MPTAHEVATELRKFADTLDANPEAKIAKPTIWWYFWGESDKEMFKRIARMFPRPLQKRIYDSASSRPMIAIESSNGIIDFEVRIPQIVTCRIIEPAKPAVYDCEPLLSEIEEAEVTA